MLEKGKFNITMDGQFGSTGKGVLNHWLGRYSQVKPDICMTNAAPNAGHTYIDDKGNKRTTFHLPVSAMVCDHAAIFLTAGSIIDPDLLEKELEEFKEELGDRNILIHPRAAILLPEHAKKEKAAGSGASNISSTQKGVGAALADKVARIPGVRVASQFNWEEVGPNCAKMVMCNEQHVVSPTNWMDEGNTILMEVPQGFSLSLNHGLAYPYCTSRDITVASALSDAGVHPSYLGSVGVSLRTFPIRVGNLKDENGVEIGYSGPFYAGSEELTWEQLGQEPELTTVTKRVRRIATFSHHQYQEMFEINKPDYIFLNFVNYANEEYLGRIFADMRYSHTHYKKTPELLIGVGPASTDVLYISTQGTEYKTSDVMEAVAQHAKQG